jgi:hypothetical protein
MKRRTLLPAILVAWLVAAHAHAVSLRIIARSTDQIPGSATAQTFAYFSAPVLNDSGQAALLSGSHNNSITPGGKIAWSESSGTLSLVAASGDAAPDMPGQKISFFNQFGFNNAGNMTLRAALALSAEVRPDNQFHTYIQTANGLEFVSRSGDPAPGVPGQVLGPLEELIFNESGDIAFLCNIGTSVTLALNHSVWKGGVGQLGLIARAGEIPGTTTSTPLITPVMDGSGNVAIATDVGVWIGQPGNLAPIAQVNDPIPGPGGLSFSGFDQEVAINSAGRYAFGGHTSAFSGIWSDRSGQLQLELDNLSTVPGVPSRLRFTTTEGVVLNDSNRIALRGMLNVGINGTIPSADSGIWSDAAGTMSLVAREGDAAPGAPAGVNFGQFDVNSYVLNGQNQIAFANRLVGAGVNFLNDVGIWATDSNGTLQLIVREGDQIEVSPGISRTIRELRFFSGTGNGDSRRSGFNDLGQLAFWAEFTDLSEAVMVSYRVAESVPGDFNHDGTVDAADYLVWRKTDGTQLGYNTWRTHFGVSLPPAQVVASAVPEPAAIVLLVVALTALSSYRLNRSR